MTFEGYNRLCPAVYVYASFSSALRGSPTYHSSSLRGLESATASSPIKLNDYEAGPSWTRVANLRYCLLSLASLGKPGSSRFTLPVIAKRGALSLVQPEARTPAIRQFVLKHGALKIKGLEHATLLVKRKPPKPQKAQLHNLIRSRAAWQQTF